MLPWSATCSNTVPAVTVDLLSLNPAVLGSCTLWESSVTTVGVLAKAMRKIKMRWQAPPGSGGLDRRIGQRFT